MITHIDLYITLVIVRSRLDNPDFKFFFLIFKKKNKKSASKYTSYGLDLTSTDALILIFP